MIESRIDILKALAGKNKISKQDFSYSSIMRSLRKEHPDKVVKFMKEFKCAFDTAHEQNLEGSEQVALMQAIKIIGL